MDNQFPVRQNPKSYLYFNPPVVLPFSTENSQSAPQIPQYLFPGNAPFPQGNPPGHFLPPASIVQVYPPFPGNPVPYASAVQQTQLAVRPMFPPFPQGHPPRHPHPHPSHQTGGFTYRSSIAPPPGFPGHHPAQTASAPPSFPGNPLPPRPSVPLQSGRPSAFTSLSQKFPGNPDRKNT